MPTIKFSHAQMRILISRVFSLALYLCLSNRLAYLLYHDVSECEFCPFRKFLRISKLTFLSETSTVSRINDNYSLFACLSILEIVVSKTFFIKKGDISIIWGHPTHTHTQHSLLTQHFYHSDELIPWMKQIKLSTVITTLCSLLHSGSSTPPSYNTFPLSPIFYASCSFLLHSNNYSLHPFMFLVYLSPCYPPYPFYINLSTAIYSFILNRNLCDGE